MNKFEEEMKAIADSPTDPSDPDIGSIFCKLVNEGVSGYQLQMVREK
jgi:hypothetical protein